MFCISKEGNMFSVKNCTLPQTVFQSVNLSAQALAGLCGVIQLPLQLPAGGVGPGGLLLRLLQLPLQLLHAGVSLLQLHTGTEKY